MEWNNGTETQKFAYIHNLQGDIIALIDNTGAKVVTYTYDAWGKPLSTTGPLAATLGKLNPFRYRGYVYDEETRLYYLRNRYYHPNRGRFINGDTLIVPSSLFAYGKNSPVNSIDFNGKDAIWINSSEWVRSADIPLGHTSLVIEYEGKWYYTMYAKDRIYHEVVPKSKMTDLETFSKQV